MTAQEINNYYTLTTRYINENMLALAFDKLKDLSLKLNDHTTMGEIEEQSNTYCLMLRYFREGMQDSRRKEITDSISKRLERINQQLNFKALSAIESSDYFCKVRSEELNSLSTPEIFKRFDEAANKVNLSEASDVFPEKLQYDYQESLYMVFNKIWTIQFLDKSSYEFLLDRLSRNDYNNSSIVVKSAILIALYFGCMRYYDNIKIRLIASSILNNGNKAVMARAVVLLAFLMSCHKNKINTDDSLASLLSLIADNEGFHNVYVSIITSYIKCVDTARINKTIKEEIIPSIMKIRPEIEKSFKELEKNLSAEESDFNPEWEEIIRNSGMEDKLRELNDLQLEGADMFMMAFEGVKRNIFFRNPVNWLLPFDKNHTSVRQTAIKLPEEFIDIISESPVFCDSDCYSLFIGLGMMPDESVKMMSSQFQSQLTQLEDDRLTDFRNTSENAVSVAVYRFMKDLYRFFNQFVNSSEYFNPFSSCIDFVALPIFGDSIDNLEDLQSLANLCFKKKMWQESVALFSRCEDSYDNVLVNMDIPGEPEFYLDYHYEAIDPVEESNYASILEKKGYAIMRLNDYSGALKTFLKSLYYQTPSIWILSRIAECLKHTGQSKLYGCFLKKALDLDPENNRLLLKMSRFLMEMDDYDNAVSILYKLHYLDSNNLHIIRTLAWCRCLQSLPDQALELYNKIRPEDLTVSDNLNRGHCYFALSRYSEAIDDYITSIEKSDLENFIQSLENDTKTLKMLSSNNPELYWTRDAAIMKFIK